MTAPTPYVHFAGTAREALSFYQSIFGGELTLHTKGDMGRDDGDAEGIGHGMLDGPVSMFGADVDAGDDGFAASGLMFALLGAADPTTLGTWFARPAEGGTVVDDLQERPWGATDGQVRDTFGLLWLIGFEAG